MSYTMYTPLNVWLDPASVTDVVAYIQTYLSENTIYSETEIETIIHDYLIAHPELIGGVQSVNGKTGTVVLSASDINTENNVTIESVLASLSSQISSIAANVATNTANITSLTGRVSTAETDLSNLKSNLNVLATFPVILFNGENVSGTFPSASSTTISIGFSKHEVSPSSKYTFYFAGLAVVDNNGNPVEDVSDYGIRVYEFDTYDGSYIKTTTYYNSNSNLFNVLETQANTHFLSVTFVARTSGKKDYTVSAANVRVYEGEDVYLALKPSVGVPQLDPINKDITEINERLGTVVYPLYPAYYDENDYMAGRIAEIRSKAATAGVNGDCFIFFTDYHTNSNAQNSPSLMSYILNNVQSVKRIVFGGDILNAHTQSVAKNMLAAFANKMKILNPVILYGNHDNNSMGTAPDTQYLPNGTVYSLIGVQNEQFADTNKDWYFYIDNPTQRIRYIFLDTGTNGNFGYVSSSLDAYKHQVDQRRWLLNLLSATENGWSVCVIAHWLFSSGALTTNGGLLLKGILDAVSQKTTYTIGVSETWDFSNKDITVIGAISGHTHYDIYAQDEGSYPIIGVTTDAYGSAASSETLPDESERSEAGAGTIYEQAFDIIQIDTDSRKIYLTRIGYGNDREFDY